MPTIPILVTDEELASLEYTAARYKVTVPVYVMRQLTDFLAKTVRLARAARLELFRKAFELDIDLAPRIVSAVPSSPTVARRRAVPAKASRRKRKGR